MNKKNLNNKIKTLFDELFTSKEITDVPDVSDSPLAHGATGLVLTGYIAALWCH